MNKVPHRMMFEYEYRLRLSTSTMGLLTRYHPAFAKDIARPIMSHEPTNQNPVKEERPMSDNKNVSHWIELVKEGDSIAANQIWQHYYDRLIRMARQKLRGQNRAVADEEDIVVSVFESFYRAAEKGRFPDLSGRDDLWRLLLTMSARKIVDRRRHEGRQRRGADAVIQSLDSRNSDNEAVIQVIGTEPTPEMVMILTESFEQLISHLGDGQLREIAVGKMEGFSNEELADRFQCSERTIERRLNLIREKCQQELMSPDE